MSTPTGGSWNNDQQGPGAPQGGQGYQGQSLGQGYGQQQGQPAFDQQQPDYGQQPQQPAYGQPQGQQPQPGYGQPGEQPQQADQGQHGGFGGHAQHVGQQFGSDAGQVVSGAGEGVGDLFSDLQFKKSLTEKIASLTFLGVIIWAVLNFISKLTYNFGSQDFGGQSVKNMSTFSGIMHTISDLVWLVVIVAIVRLALELAINVARIAQRSKD
ncbi:hypothetical protein GCM10011492_21540 [Flexivirga endophytica]|uniref:DUF4282 domain-containing protein n=1 Tax=Flexivirga endophytica TaxID=1849103 RepID=A0A916WUE9_9MICO|nr:DUF4282 domain-containing protein [Flexivirga endophytica]GGB30739.1 hypothetical protein GCM10011492_21540 [Flexivirga endophytica]GHB51657.1 hypothetical protein GCM10008112_20810 [Flexivirga endophytica]